MGAHCFRLSFTENDAPFVATAVGSLPAGRRRPRARPQVSHALQGRGASRRCNSMWKRETSH